MVTRVRRTSEVIEGQRETATLAGTLGQVVRAGRRAKRMSLGDLAARVGLSRTRIAEIERGEGTGASLHIWVAIGIALDRPLAVSFSRPLDTSRGPVDAGHLEIQEHALRLARATGRHGTFELPTRPGDPARSTDVGIRDDRHRVLIDAAFPGSSRRWVAALTQGKEPPTGPGLVWYDPSTRRLTEHRRATMPS